MYTQWRSYPLYLDHAWQTVEYKYPGNVSYIDTTILFLLQEEYRLCYEALNIYIESTNVYANF